MRLLLVDDDPEIRTSVRVGFELQWRDVEILEAASGGECLRLVEERRPDLVLLDVGLPDLDGFAVLRELRAFSAVPVIMLTARDEPIDRVRGLEAGADDYVAKPFDHLELMARVRAVLRRLDVKAPTPGRAPYRNGPLEIDTEAHEARVDGVRVALTATEWRVLELLAANAGWVVPHERLVARVWGREDPGDLESLRVFVGRLRSKLGDDATAPRYIETVRGLAAARAYRQLLLRRSSRRVTGPQPPARVVSRSSGGRNSTLRCEAASISSGVRSTIVRAREVPDAPTVRAAAAASAWLGKSVVT
jgi:two-component system, OmpR family, KDP operon response regulator KdpE